MYRTNHPLYLSYLLDKRDNAIDKVQANKELNEELKKQGLIP